MIRRLQVSMSGEELSRRIAERISVHSERLQYLDGRVKAREGDTVFDVRAEDDYKTFGELQSEQQQHRERVADLTLLRDHLASAAVYVLGAADLRLADLIASDEAGDSTRPGASFVEDPSSGVIMGLMLAISGGELRERLEQEIGEHRRRAERWRAELARTPADQTDDEPLLPEHMCENEAERHDWRAEVLNFIRDHVDAGEVYRLGERDLAFAELLPEKPGWLEQEEYEERNGVRFELHQLTRKASARLTVCTHVHTLEP